MVRLQAIKLFLFGTGIERLTCLKDAWREEPLVCRNIKTLFNLDPPATDEEIRASALQFVRKVTGFNKPSKVNEAAFLGAVDDVAAVARSLVRSLQTNAPPRNRADEQGYK